MFSNLLSAPSYNPPEECQAPYDLVLQADISVFYQRLYVTQQDENKGRQNRSYLLVKWRYRDYGAG